MHPLSRQSNSATVYPDQVKMTDSSEGALSLYELRHRERSRRTKRPSPSTISSKLAINVSSKNYLRATCGNMRATCGCMWIHAAYLRVACGPLDGLLAYSTATRRPTCGLLDAYSAASCNLLDAVQQKDSARRAIWRRHYGGVCRGPAAPRGMPDIWEQGGLPVGYAEVRL